MKKVLGLSISVGLVGAAWTLIANQLGILAWPGFIGWTIYFYGGADSKSIKHSLPSVFLGVFLAYLSAIIQNNFFSNGLWIFIPAFLLSLSLMRTVQQRILMLFALLQNMKQMVVLVMILLFGIG